MTKPTFALVSLYNPEAMGLRSLHAVLKENGYDVKLIFLKTDTRTREDNFTCSPPPMLFEDKHLFLNLIMQLDPDILGFSVVSSHVPIVMDIIKYIRPHFEGKILLGGIHPTLNPEDSIKFADIVCIGEGESAILDVGTGCRLSIISGDQEKNLDRLPIPVFSNEDCYIIDEGLWHKDPAFDNTRYGIMTVRGCLFKCSYCSNNYISKLYPNNPIRTRSASHVLKELFYMKRILPKVERINFYDEVFVRSVKWLDEFNEGYKDIGLPFFCMFYPGMEKESIIKKLKEMGLAGVWLGIQSGSERIRKNIFFRNHSNLQVFRAAKLFQKYGISVRYDFILNNPFETAWDKIQTLKMLMKLPKPYSANLFSLAYFPNTDITNMALEKGYIKESQVEGNDSKSFDTWIVRLNDYKRPLTDIFMNKLSASIVRSAERI